MAEQLRVRLRETNEEMMIDELVPTGSAVLYKQISDEIWRDGRIGKMSIAYKDAIIPPDEAQKLLNDVVSEIDPSLVLTGNGVGDLGLGSRQSDVGTVRAEDLRVPQDVRLCTYNWDSPHGTRLVEVDENLYVAEIISDQVDYYRELSVNMIFRDRRPRIFGGYAHQVSIDYGIQRSQKAQDGPASMFVSAFHGGFAETGYEGQSIGRADLTIEQEMKFLCVLQQVGGIAVDSAR